jgi:hypothetical protein
VLNFHMMDAVSLGDYCGKIQDVDGTTRIGRMRAPLDDRIKTVTHHRDAIQFGLIGGLPPRCGRTDRYR